jgi:predicted nuclease of predicted toxin-antitoxin system
MRPRLFGNVSRHCGTRHEILIDNNLSLLVSDKLKAAGHDATHVRDFGLQAATDQVVLARARGDNRVLIPADTDFGTLLAREGADRPSILLIRRLSGRRAAEPATIILANLDVVAEDLDSDAVVVLTDEWVRVRRLPIVS